jgi:hypothetical protein
LPGQTQQRGGAVDAATDAQRIRTVQLLAEGLQRGAGHTAGWPHGPGGVQAFQ